MPIIRKPEPFIIGKTMPHSVSTPTGRRYDLSAHLRVDLTAAIRRCADLRYLLDESGDSGKQSKITDFPTRSNTKDFILEKVFRTAWDFGYIDKDSYEYVGYENWDRDLYERGLKCGWYSPYLRLDIRDIGPDRLNLDSFPPVRLNSRKRINYAELVIPREDIGEINDLRVMEIKCRESIFRSLLRKLSKSSSSLQWQQDPNIIWMGDLFDFMPIFRFDPENPSIGPIDDRLDPIKSLKINPDGFFALEFAKRGEINLKRLINAAIIGAICQNVPFLELDFISDSVFLNFNAIARH